MDFIALIVLVLISVLFIPISTIIHEYSHAFVMTRYGGKIMSVFIWPLLFVKKEGGGIQIRWWNGKIEQGGKTRRLAGQVTWVKPDGVGISDTQQGWISIAPMITAGVLTVVLIAGLAITGGFPWLVPQAFLIGWAFASSIDLTNSVFSIFFGDQIYTDIHRLTRSWKLSRWKVWICSGFIFLNTALALGAVPAMVAFELVLGPEYLKIMGSAVMSLKSGVLYVLDLIT